MVGTSASSKGPTGGVPMVPPWVPPIPPLPAAPPDPQDQDADMEGGPADGNPAPAAPVPTVILQPSTQIGPIPLAASGRFFGARLNLGKFASSGGKTRHLRRALSDYVRKGYGGRGTTVRRFGGTAATANRLYGALSDVARGQVGSGASPLDPALLAGRSAREVMDAVVEAVRPSDGTQDAEASRAAIKDAMSELLTLFPNADLLNLNEEQRQAAIERFVAIDVHRRVMLDIGKAIQDKAPTAVAGLARIKEVKDYIKQTVASAFRKLRRISQFATTTGRVNQIVRAVLEETFKIFEDYLE